MNLKYLDSALRAKVTACTALEEILVLPRRDGIPFTIKNSTRSAVAASGMLPSAPTTAPKTSWRESVPPSSVSAATGALFWKLGQAC